ncbi:Endonuclease/exonuclease/phosphatase [Globomyces pollinis-pini]|nr:Endonuclease/exonuclease/phosphatase [Globomyces pollinis-pini]KAJ3000892.1 Glucose-repressible alcohol dehydrogenase transcriptional effector [Globomyces sp. JEL0801]
MPNGYQHQLYVTQNRMQAQQIHYKQSNNAIQNQLYQLPTNNHNHMLGQHHMKQMEAANRARLAHSPHHFARVAASQQRISNNPQPQVNAAINPHASDINLVPNVAKQQESSTWTALDMGGMMINNLHVGLFKYQFLTCLYLNHNNLTSLPPSISKLQNLTILNVTGNKLSSLPIELSLVVSLKELLLFDNQLTYVPPEFGQLYQLEMLGLEGNPMSEPINSMIIEKGTSVVVKYLRDSCPCPPPPSDREWMEVDDGFGSSSSDVFTVMCYNTLCEKYATPQTYGYTPSWALSWDYRKDLLLQEILNYSADIVCLQEVEMRQFEDFFKEQLSQLADYDGVFFPKSRAKTMPEYERRQVDGCVTMYKTSKFKLLQKQHIEFQQIAMQRPDLNRSDDVLNRVMIKDNVGVVVLLEAKDTGAKILVANAHLHWDPNYSDVKVIQTALLVDEVERLSKEWSKIHKFQSPPPILICGDLNSLPDSGVVEFLSQGSIAADHPELQNFNYHPFIDNGLTHSLKLKSAYAHCEDIDFTNFTPMFKGMIDYIWYDTSSLITTGLLGGVDKQYAAKTVGFPNPHHPSDHIPLVVSIRIKGTTAQKKVAFK